MESIAKSIDVKVPIHVAYNQWTQFESFPMFMQGVQEVHQLDDRHLHWVAKIGGREEEWDATITAQIPDERLAWHSTSGAHNAGLVTFRRLSNGETRVTLELDYEPEGPIEQIGDKLSLLPRRVEGDLEQFKAFIERLGSATGGWRGEIQGQRVEEPVRKDM